MEEEEGGVGVEEEVGAEEGVEGEVVEVPQAPEVEPLGVVER